VTRKSEQERSGSAVTFGYSRNRVRERVRENMMDCRDRFKLQESTTGINSRISRITTVGSNDKLSVAANRSSRGCLLLALASPPGASVLLLHCLLSLRKRLTNAECERDELRRTAINGTPHVLPSSRGGRNGGPSGKNVSVTLPTNSADVNARYIMNCEPQRRVGFRGNRVVVLDSRYSNARR